MQSKFLGIDYGEKRVGVAISDISGRIAFPHDILDNQTGLEQKILNIARANEVSTVVLGESKNFAGEDNPVMPLIRGLAERLEESGLEVVLEPEHLTSAAAKRSLPETRKRQKVDASAAALILQSYLDRPR